MVVYRILNRCRRVPVDLIFRLPVVFSNEIVEITISAGFTNLSGPAVAACDLVYCSLSFLRFVLSLTLVSSRRKGVIGLQRVHC